MGVLSLCLNTVLLNTAEKMIVTEISVRLKVREKVDTCFDHFLFKTMLKGWL